MKRIIILMFCVCGGMFASAQDMNMDEGQQIRSILKKEKKDLVGEYMGLSASEASNFWPLYEEFENQRAGLSKERFQLIKDYGAQYKMLTDDQAKGLAKRAFKNEKAYLKLKEKYFKKISKKLSPLKAAQFVQLEDYFQTLVRSEVQDAIPFIGEIERKKGQ